MMFSARLLICAALLLVAPVTAWAYCRATTTAPTPTCPSHCEEQGAPLFWSPGEITYVFNAGGFPGVPATTVKEEFRRAFDAWSKVDCGSASPLLELVAGPSTTVLTSGPIDAEPDQNVIVLYSAEEWRTRKLPSRAYALTALWFDTASGEILGADMQLNGGMGSFVRCQDSGCSVGEIDLRNVATHEAGHFLGLGHSDRPESSMWCSASPTDLGKRQLSSDDELGFCAIYGAASRAAEATQDEQVRGAASAGCSLSRDQTVNLASFLALSLLACRRRVRRGNRGK